MNLILSLAHLRSHFHAKTNKLSERNIESFSAVQSSLKSYCILLGVMDDPEEVFMGKHHLMLAVIKFKLREQSQKGSEKIERVCLL